VWKTERNFRPPKLRGISRKINRAYNYRKRFETLFRPIGLTLTNAENRTLTSDTHTRARAGTLLCGRGNRNVMAVFGTTRNRGRDTKLPFRRFASLFEHRRSSLPGHSFGPGTFEISRADRCHLTAASTRAVGKKGPSESLAPNVNNTRRVAVLLHPFVVRLHWFDRPYLSRVHARYV